MMRYIRAFIKALSMTLRGESIAPTPKTPAHFLPLEAWIHDGLQKLAQVTVAADTNDLTQAQREQLILKLDGRDTSFEQSLQMVRHNLINEYPKLIALDDAYTMMVIQSSNMNDQYRISRFMLSDDISTPAIQQAIEDLNDHLLNLPTINRPDPTAS